MAYEALMLLIKPIMALQVCLSSETELASSRNLPKASCMRAAGVPWGDNKRRLQWYIDVSAMRGYSGTEMFQP